MPKATKPILPYLLLLLIALSFRVGVAVFLPNDDPDDAKVYTQIARNILEQKVYSHSTEAPYDPSLIRLPGYPLFLAATYAVSGHGNNTAVRIVQAVIDTATCGLIALVTFYWEPDPERKRASSIGALAIATICPFTTIYVTTILTETPTNFLAVAMFLTATVAFRAQTVGRNAMWWAITGLVSGLAVLFRPDAGLFAAAIGVTLVITTIFTNKQETQEGPPSNAGRRLFRAFYLGALFSLAFCLVLLPWTIRNRRVFHVFQPLAPAHAEMPGEFVPHGYLRWLRTWLDDETEIAPFLWALDTFPIHVEQMPSKAFDSEQEKQQVGALLNQYNQTATQEQEPEEPKEESLANGIESLTLPGAQKSEAKPSPQPSPSASEEENEDEGDEEEEQPEEAKEEPQSVEMTPEIDAGFARIANERIARAPFRYYVKLPLKRAVGLWFNTHSQYWPFEGTLFAPPDDEHDLKQQIFLPLFTAMTWIYTFLAIVGAWFLWTSRQFAARRWLLMTALIVVLRIGFFSQLENPEPRYVVELFPFVCILGGIALTRVIESFGVGPTVKKSSTDQ
jgi:Dolichyl-phosphate-mannose-protein mannosyltransferase